MPPIPVSIGERRVFVDTSAFFALVAHNDTYFEQSLKILDRLRTERYRLVTTKYVIYEAHAGILAATSGKAARILLHGMANSAAKLVRVTGHDEARAVEIVDRFLDKDYSLCDATSLAVEEASRAIAEYCRRSLEIAAGLTKPAR